MFRDSIAKIRAIVSIVLLLIISVALIKKMPIISIGLLIIAIIRAIIYMIADEMSKKGGE